MGMFYNSFQTLNKFSYPKTEIKITLPYWEVRFPLTNTTKTAAYAAQAPKSSDLLAFVANPTHAANATVYPAINPSRFWLSGTQ
jgi:hypothetical protein